MMEISYEADKAYGSVTMTVTNIITNCVMYWVIHNY